MNLRYATAGLLLALAMVGTPVDGRQASAAFPGANGKIAFHSSIEKGNTDVYVMNPDGTGLIRLTTDPAADFLPSWSADGQQIVFVSERDGNREIYRMQADGSAQQRLTSNGVPDDFPSWSPDGSKIAFYSNRDGNEDIYRMNADGTGEIRLTSHAAVDAFPAWSPDGTKIAFSSERTGRRDIFTMNPDGSNQVSLTVGSPAGGDSWPDWSPDGASLTFTSTRDGNEEEVYRINSDGTDPTRLTTNLRQDDFPVWSPDGLKIAFARSQSTVPLFRIHVMDSDGSNQSAITTEFSVWPDWQPLAGVGGIAQPPATFVGSEQDDRRPWLAIGVAGGFLASMALAIAVNRRISA